MLHALDHTIDTRVIFQYNKVFHDEGCTMFNLKSETFNFRIILSYIRTQTKRTWII